MKYIAYKEDRKHGTFDFPIEFYHVTPTHPRYEMSYHWHIEYEIIRILEGELLMTVSEDEFTAHGEDIVFVKGGLLHGGIPKDCLYECLVFNLDSLILSSHAAERLLKKISGDSVSVYPVFRAGSAHVHTANGQTDPQVVGDHNSARSHGDVQEQRDVQGRTVPTADSRLTEIVSTLFGQMQSRREGYELAVIGSLYEFFGYILENRLYTEGPSVQQKDARRIEHLKKALEKIESSYADCLTLDDLASEAGMNSKYFCRYFREMTHRTPIDYLNYYRVEQACFKLATTNESITDVGLSCGFNDVSYFIKMFKKYKGVTPKKYLSAPL